VLNVPGQMVELEVDLWSTACVFKAGHQVVAHVSRNTANPSGRGDRFRSAENNGFTTTHRHPTSNS